MPRTDAVLLDTHTLLWWQADGERLSDLARGHITSAVEVLVSPVSCWEISMLVEKGRVVLDRPTVMWVNDLFTDPRIEVAELTSAVAVEAGQLHDFHGDPADRLIYATSRAAGVSLITKDRRLHDYAQHDHDVTVIW